jgi:hypothetical protein
VVGPAIRLGLFDIHDDYFVLRRDRVGIAAAASVISAAGSGAFA